MRKVTREAYANHANELSDFSKEKLNEEVITGINFGEDAMIIMTKSKMLVYSVLNKKVFFTRNGTFWDAALIPNTSMMAYVEHNGAAKSRRTLIVFDLEKEERVAFMTITFEIEEIKVSKNCICLVGSNELSVVHFPTLKPICHELAGSGLKVIYDISFEGLTLAFDSKNKGEVIIHNFSSVLNHRRKKSADDIKANPNRSFLRRSVAGTGKSFLSRSILNKAENPRKNVKINAHHECKAINT